MPLVDAENRIDQRLHLGGSLAEVEEEIIDPAPLSEEHRAALWLYASATFPGHLAEAMAETAKRPSPRLGGISTALRSAGSATASRIRGTAQRLRGEVPHGGA